MSRNVASIAASLGSPKPRRSRSRVPRCGSSNKLITGIAPVSTKRSAWGDWLSRNRGRSSAKRVSTRSKLCPFALERLSSRARTEAPIFLISLAIGGQRLQIGADDRADPACLRGPGDLCRRGFALAQSLLEALERDGRSDEHTSELQSLMRISYAVFC